MRATFNVRLHDAYLPDRVGREVADAAEARLAARAVVRGLVHRHGAESRLLDAAMVVCDEAGAVIVEMAFYEALYLPVEPVVREAAVRRPAAPRPAGLLSEIRLGAALRPVRRLADAVSARVQPLLGP